MQGRSRKFQGVIEETFNSMLRRSLVVCFKGRFYTEEHVLQRYGSVQAAAKSGAFIRDPSLKEFLKEDRTVGASVKHLEGFMLEHTEQDCVDIVENYACHGLDAVSYTHLTLPTICSV